MLFFYFYVIFDFGDVHIDWFANEDGNSYWYGIIFKVEKILGVGFSWIPNVTFLASFGFHVFDYFLWILLRCFLCLAS